MTGARLTPGAHDAYDQVEDQFNQVLDETLHPAGPGALFDYVAGMGLPDGAVSVDVGCGGGEHAVELARRFGLRVTGIDPVARQVTAARELAGAGDLVRFAVGSAERLPVASGSVDLIWCRDVLCLCADLSLAYREFRRVLRPGGRALVYQMFATSGLRPAEAAFLLPVLGCDPAAMDPDQAEAAISGAGLVIDRRVILGTEWGEYASERAANPGRHLQHAARLIRDPGRYIAQFGQENYDIKLADCLWHIYRMIGKLSSRVYLLSAPG